MASDFGEDVDFAWRLHDAGWRLRYEPAAVVAHREPRSWAGLLARRWRYGTSAAPLAQRHPHRLAPAVLAPLPTAAATLALAGRPAACLAAVTGQAAAVHRRTGTLGVPASRAFAWSAQASVDTLAGAGFAATALAAPALLALAARPRTRSAAIALLTASPLLEWRRRRPRLDPLRWCGAAIADDVAYGAGVWWGCARSRTLRPLLPTLRVR